MATDCLLSVPRVASPAEEPSREKRRPPRDYGPGEWGEKNFREVDDEVLRQELEWLQSITRVIKAAQSAEGMPPEELARRAGVSERALTSVLRGAQWPSYHLLAATMALLKVRWTLHADLRDRPKLPADPNRKGHFRHGRRRQFPPGSAPDGEQDES